ncbi:MAG TPA: hypothetical protein VMN58_13075 [Acidimicrobiales bacterium]|nr:hypothetical protein [Acidimicrobiales bacterium]
MASLSFEGETHGEIVLKIKRWLQSVEGGEDVTALTPAEAVTRGAELTKDALRVIASAAPQPVRSSDLLKSLTAMGYTATDQTRDAVVAGLDSLHEVSGGSFLNRVDDARKSVVYEMNAAVARQLLKALKG